MGDGDINSLIQQESNVNNNNNNVMNTSDVVGDIDMDQKIK